MIAISRLYWKVNILNEYPTGQDAIEGFFAYSETFRAITPEVVLQFQQDFARLLLMMRNYEDKVQVQIMYNIMHKKASLTAKTEQGSHSGTHLVPIKEQHVSSSIC
jgi:hypothetical protein